MFEPMRRAAGVLVLASIAVAGCAADSSTELGELRTDRDELAAELDDVRTELDEVDDELAVANARLADAEADAALASAAFDDLDAFLTLDLMNRVGLDRVQSACVSEVLIGDDELRGSYLLLIDQERARADGEAAADAFDTVMAALDDCGVDTSSAEDTAEQTAADQAALVELLGDVEVTGEALPAFAEGGDPALGTSAPVLSGFDYAGEPVTIDAAANGPTMVVVVAHWCPHCNVEIPKLVQLDEEGRIPDTVNVVAVSSALNPEAPNFPPDRWLEEIGWTRPVLADGIDLGTGSFVGYQAYGVSGVPFVVLLDGQGNVVQRWAGERDPAFLETAVLTLAEIG